MRWIVWLTLGGALLIIAGSAALPAGAQQGPGTYREAVIAVLDAYDLPYEDVRVVHGCAPSYQNCRSYHGEVTIIGTRTHTGAIDCRERWTNCTLTLPGAGVRAPLADVVEEPLVDRVRRVVEEVREQIRAAR
ncbi:MAG TPA: hypothetical protein PKA05_20245 [Roseiflexaceae bacterium]|nr:hypothetical protein [Roseiflexaceae bacterium]